MSNRSLRRLAAAMAAVVAGLTLSMSAPVNAAEVGCDVPVRGCMIVMD